MVVLVAGRCTNASPAPSSAVVPADPTAAATAFCDDVWSWYRASAERFNEMSDAARTDLTPTSDGAILLEALDDFEQRNVGLGSLMAEHGGPVAELADQVRRDIPASVAAVDDMRRSVVEEPEIDEQRPQVRLSQMVVTMEKVIDPPRPEITADDTELLAVLRTVPSCQFAVKGADDGVGRYSG